VPTYQYACTECGHQLEAVQSFTDDALTVCPECAGRLRKLFSSVGIVFKGSGFYRNDSRAEEKAPANGSAAEGAGKDGAGKEAAGKDGPGKNGSGKDGAGKDAGGGSGSGEAPKSGAKPAPAGGAAPAQAKKPATTPAAA
jgi:putative FmdB family regulatory protein